MTKFLNSLKKFEKRHGTGVKVNRTTVSYNSDPETYSSAGETAEVEVLNGIRFLETVNRQVSKELLDQWGLQVGQVYEVSFRNTDNVQLEDIVQFNTNKEKAVELFDPNLEVTSILLKKRDVGFSDHYKFTGVTQ